ncbi:hypothetical protein I4U23_029394 [Adineta vaga]|nr:hypothetical protein I4U23_029394 [Adineta vaga]
MSETSRPRGRGRAQTNKYHNDYASISISPTPRTSSLSSIPSSETANRSDSGVSTASSDDRSTQTTPDPIPIGRGRGRGTLTKRINPPPDPFWTVTELSKEQFNTYQRPTKPDQLGDLGEQYRVFVNYFPILQFPRKGLVYQYHIQIRNKKDFEIHRDRRRLFYNSWLHVLCQKHPEIDPHKIVFDNQSTVLSFDQLLPEIDENVTHIIHHPSLILTFIHLDTCTNHQWSQSFQSPEPHKVIVQRVGSPVDLSLIANLNELFDPASLTNDRMEDLQQVKQVLSIALHEYCSSNAAFIYNRSFFASSADGRQSEWDLGLGKAMWRGFYSCLVFSKGKHQLLMNLDGECLDDECIVEQDDSFVVCRCKFVCEVMLHSPSGKRKYGQQRNASKADGDDVLQYLDVHNRNYRNDADFLLKHCKHLRVRSQNADKPIIYEIVKLGLPACSQQFQWKSHKRLTTIEEYYREEYCVSLKYPSLPTLEMRNGSFIPMELVDVEPVRIKKITDEQRALMCRCSTISPSSHRKMIEIIRHDRGKQRFEEDPFVAAWKLNVDVKMLTVPARVLPMPEILYTDNYRVTSKGMRNPGHWDLKTTKFFKAADFPKIWAMINLSDMNQDDCKEFYDQLSMVAEERGVKCTPPVIYIEQKTDNNSNQKIVSILKDMMIANTDCTFFLVILPDQNIERTWIYNSIKKLCELEFGFGIITQMIRIETIVGRHNKNIGRIDYSTLNNILLKINTKLNGINHLIKIHSTVERFFSKGHRVMYVGADLSHAAPGAITQPSIVAVVASADDIPNRYFKEVYQQYRPPDTREESRELIVDLKQIMKSLITQYVQHRGYPPTAIVFYRDGISESEFDSVFEYELTGIREACIELSPVYRPYLTYIVVSKRHHTRIFPTNSEKNVPAGTVVDSHDITNVTKYDFYLNSHFGALGTSRPTHYYVLYDDNKLKPNEVQMLTYALCYTYARCTRSVSIPAPVKYADLLAIRATLYIKSDDQSDTESVASGPRLPVNQNTDVESSIRSERIVLSSKLAPDCPYFL